MILAERLTPCTPRRARRALRAQRLHAGRRSGASTPSTSGASRLGKALAQPSHPGADERDRARARARLRRRTRSSAATGRSSDPAPALRRRRDARRLGQDADASARSPPWTTLHDAGIHFAVTSGRPPRGMSMLVEPLALAHADRGLQRRARGRARPGRHRGARRSRRISSRRRSGCIESFELSVWVYRGADWLVLDPDGPHVDARGAHGAVLEPTVVAQLRRRRDGVAKIVGVSDDHASRRGCGAGRAQDEFGDDVSASRSQPYYLDVTHPDANKGSRRALSVASGTASRAARDRDHRRRAERTC